MDFSIGARRAAGYSTTGSTTRTGIPLESARPDSTIPLRKTGAGIPIDRGESRAFPVGGKRFALSATETKKDPEAERLKLRKAAEGFEAIFIRQLLQTMRASATEDGMYGGGATGEMYADMVESALADAMAKEGQFGIADALCRRMTVRDAAGVAEGKTPSENTAKAGGER